MIHMCYFLNETMQIKILFFLRIDIFNLIFLFLNFEIYVSYLNIS